MARVEDIAKLAGVSTASVSRVLNQSANVRPETQERVLKAAKELGIDLTERKTEKRKPRTGNFGAIVTAKPGQSRQESRLFQLTAWVADVLAGIEQTLSHAGYNTFVSHMSLLDPNTNLPRFVEQGQVDGVFILGGFFEDVVIERMRNTGVPVVIVGSYSHLPGVQAVFADNTRGVYRLTKHLLETGRRRIGLLSGPRETRTSFDKQWGYRLALEEYGLPYDASLVRTLELSNFSAYQAMEQWQQTGSLLDGVYCGSACLAVGVYEYSHDQGLDIPKDLAVVGHDTDRISLTLQPQLTSAEWYCFGMGRKASSLMLEAVDEVELLESHVVLPVTMHVRESSAAPQRRSEKKQQSS